MYGLAVIASVARLNICQILMRSQQKQHAVSIITILQPLAKKMYACFIFNKPEIFQPVLAQAKFVEELMFKYSDEVTKFEAITILLLKITR